MITRLQAVQIGVAVVDARNSTVKLSTPMEARMINGTASMTIDNIWYEVLPNKTKAEYDYDKQLYLTAIGWNNS